MFDRFMANRKLKCYASSIRERLKRQKSGGHVTKPLLQCDAIGKVVGLPLMAWLYFNPFGPTMCAVCSVEVPGSQEHLLTFLMVHWKTPTDASEDQLQREARFREIHAVQVNGLRPV